MKEINIQKVGKADKIVVQRYSRDRSQTCLVSGTVKTFSSSTVTLTTSDTDWYTTLPKFNIGIVVLCNSDQEVEEIKGELREAIINCGHDPQGFSRKEG